MEKEDNLFKVIILGFTPSGKTDFFKKICEGIFLEKSAATIGYEKRQVCVELNDGKKVF